jgi:cobalt-zinc-cadmium efflux system outer membrane protein
MIGSMLSTVGVDADRSRRQNDGRREGMRTREFRTRLMRLASAIVTMSLFLGASAARAQGPQFDVGSPPGAAGGASAVGQPLGAANFPDFGSPSNAPFSGRAGPMGAHVPASALTTPGVPVVIGPGAQQTIRQNAPALEIPQVGEALELDSDISTYGQKGGTTLDAAIEQLVSKNLDLLAAKLEVPMAEADVLTANLRTNPIFYADTQLIPYGHFSFLRPGGPPQSDININYPLDVSFKRVARTRSAREAKSAVEAQLQDAVRNQIDNLYTYHVGVVQAGLTLQLAEVFRNGLVKLEAVARARLKEGNVRPDDYLAVRANLLKSELNVRNAKQAKIKANRAFALILNLPLEEVDSLDVLDPVGQLQGLPMPRRDLVKKALDKRPDLMAWKYGVRRAEADLKLAKANGYPDIYLLYQPYTFQNNTYLGVPSAYSWTLGLTASIPIYNRNQGNVTRAKINIHQSAVQVASAERVVVSDVLNAAQELEQSKSAVAQFRVEILPPAREVKEVARRRMLGGEISMDDFLDAQRDYNEYVSAYLDALIRHRNAILDLNTAVGERLLP